MAVGSGLSWPAPGLGPAAALSGGLIVTAALRLQGREAIEQPCVCPQIPAARKTLPALPAHERRGGHVGAAPGGLLLSQAGSYPQPPRLARLDRAPDPDERIQSSSNHGHDVIATSAVYHQRRCIIILQIGETPAEGDPAMPQRPKTFRIGHIVVQAHERSAMVRTGPKRAAPSRFTAYAQLRNPDVQVAVTVALEDGAVPVVEELAIRPGKKTPVNSTVLRGILLDQIVPAVVKAASKPITERPDVLPGAFQVSGEPDENQAWVSPAPGANEKVLQAARIYRDALSAGSRAPAAIAAEEMKLSRAQVARYIRKAREAGLLPSVDDVVKGRVPAPASRAPDPGPQKSEVRMRRLADPSLW